jgi:hypothetical protein
MEEKFAKACTYGLLVALLATGVIAIASTNSFVLAQPCEAQLGSPSVATQQYYYYGGNFQVSVPVSATCSFYPGQLYATGTAYDTTYNTNIGSANTALSSTYGGYGFTGQLSFTLPSSAQYHSVQFTVSIYGTQNGYYGGYYNGYYGGALLAQTSSTFVVSPSYYNQGYPSYPYYPAYPSYPNYPYYPSYHYYYPGSGYYYGYYYHYYYGGHYNNCGRWHNGCPGPHH